MGGEAVLFTPAVGLAILRILTLLLIPVLPLAAVREATKVIGPANARFTPHLEIAAVTIGVLFAPLLLVASTTDNILDLRDVFRPQGPWDLDFIQFLTRRALPLLLSPAELLGAVLTGRAVRSATLELRGGKLGIEWRERGESANHVLMTGEAVEVFSGEVEVGDGEIVPVVA